MDSKEQIKLVESAPEELQLKIAKAFLNDSINNEDIQTNFEDTDFFDACQETNGVEVIIDIEEDIDGIGAVDEDNSQSDYSPRLTTPSKTDPHWIYYKKGGYNQCIKIGGNECIPNCVGYAWGRDLEVRGETTSTLSKSNAENWYGNTKDGRQRGMEPKLGAIACWRKGKAGVAADGAGHVAIVEAIDEKTGITTFSNSAYKGKRFYLTKMKAPYNLGSKYTFQGFIYSTIDFDKKIKEPIAQPEPQPIESPVVVEEPFKIGDKVKIVGTGNGSSRGTANTAYGIGWTRQILKIWKDRAYPYQVGNNKGTTGFYKAEALKKK